MADDQQEETAIRSLLSENQRLKQRLFEFEEKLRKAAPTGESAPSSGSSVLKLIEHKDFQLEQYAARLEEKKDQLEEAVRELESRNAQLALWMASLRLYQDIFENDASAMIGVNREGCIILFNRTAPQLLGEKFKEALHKPIETADFRAFEGAGSPSGSTVCRVGRARCRRLTGGARFDLVANHFLYHMVRNIVGTALRVADERDPATAMREILDSRERTRAGVTAPPQGLCLERVEYGEEGG